MEQIDREEANTQEWGEKVGPGSLDAAFSRVFPTVDRLADKNFRIPHSWTRKDTCEAYYNVRQATPSFEADLDRWLSDSRQARSRTDHDLDVPYGPHPMMKMDIFKPRGPSRGLFMFIHGGYWKQLDKGEHSFLAPALNDAGITVAVPNYDLCPKITLDGIVMQMVHACTWLYRNGSKFGAPRGPFGVGGHSAGGHLAAMMMACRFDQYGSDLPRNLVRGSFCISGIYDVAPIVNVSVNSELKLDAALADRCSPALMRPATDAPVYVTVGSDEPEGFLEQTRLLRHRWKSVVRGDEITPATHHFNILYRFADPTSDYVKTVLNICGVS